MSKKKTKKRTRVPREELVLAEMIANGQSHGLKFASGATGLDSVVKKGTRGVMLFEPCGSGHSCAIGAYLACKSRSIDYLSRWGMESGDYSELGQYTAFERAAGVRSGDVYIGNDRTTVDDYGWTSRAEGIGVAYRAFHKVNE